MKLLPMALAALAVIAPWTFELVTFYYYTHGDSEAFFVLSGARLPFFVIAEVALGASIGFTSSRTNFPLYATITIAAVGLLVLLLYQLCDARGCYYSDPDKLGELRLFALLASAAASGVSIGGMRRSLESGANEYGGMPRFSLLFFLAVPFFTASFSQALLQNVPSDIPFSVFLSLVSMAAAYVSAGFALSVFFIAGRLKTVALSLIVEIALFLVFRNWAAVTEANGLEASLLQLAAGLVSAVGFSLAGHTIGRRLARKFAPGPPARRLLSNQELALLGFYVATLLTFALSNWHFGVYAPVDMLPREINETYVHGNLLSGAPSPVYYAGAYDTASYFHTSRLEVTIDLDSTDKIKALDLGQRQLVLLAGMGAQSPNCCKDGLDYGYRADVAIAANGRSYLEARAWETCDQNAACSGFPWQATMHESETAFQPGNHTKVSLAMQWSTEGGKKVSWYYRLDNTSSWQEYSVFSTPAIENPAFNVGVIPVNNFATNFPSGNANFFQVGVAAQSREISYLGIAFECPAYFEGNERHCFPDLSPIKDGDSHWKVFWQWGLPASGPSVAVNNSEHTVKIAG